MSTTRVPSLLEQSLKSAAGGTNPAVRTALDVYSKAESNALTPVVDLSGYTLLTTTASISGGLDTRLDAVEANLDVVEANQANYATITLVGSITGALATDIENLDVSLTEKIATDCMQSTGISGSGTGVYGYLNITINGVPFKLALIS